MVVMHCGWTSISILPMWPIFWKRKVQIMLVPCVWTEKCPFSCLNKNTTPEKRNCWATCDRCGSPCSAGKQQWHVCEPISLVDEYHFKRWERNNEARGVTWKIKCCSPIFWNVKGETNGVPYFSKDYYMLPSKTQWHLLRKQLAITSWIM